MGQRTTLSDLKYAFLLSAGTSGIGDNLRPLQNWLRQSSGVVDNAFRQMDQVVRNFGEQVGQTLDNMARQMGEMLGNPRTPASALVFAGVAGQADDLLETAGRQLDDLGQDAVCHMDSIPEFNPQIGSTQPGHQGSGVYIPRNADGSPIPLKKQRLNGQDIPLPDPAAEGRAHTVLGGTISSKTGELYRQSASFPNGTWPRANGYEVPWSEVHWTDHGTPHHHPSPHQHIFEYNPDKGGWIRREPSRFNP